ncbi:MAG TPA: ABC transporter substrate-binding protein, partial [Actinomycetota bacterium]|nr:ABC transporter substrate-binding protein [Actinomycetota bacterium]
PRNRSKPAAAAFLAIAFSLLLTACPGKPLPRPRATGTPVSGGTLRVTLTDDVDSLDPARAARPSAWFFVRAMYRGLLAFPDLPAPDGTNPVPDLAASMPAVSPDGLTYRFQLRSGITFGAPASRPIRASDARASIQRVISSGVGIAPFLGSITAMSAPDAQTLVISLSRVTPDLPWILAQPQAAIVPADTPPPGTIAPDQISPSGPYRLTSYVPEASIALARNPAWSAGSDPLRAAYVDDIDATINVPAARAFAETVAGTADVVLDTGAPDLRAGTVAFPVGARAVRSGNGCTRYLFMNTSVAPFNKAAVRIAVASAVVRARFDGADAGGTPATRLLPPTVTGHDTTPVVPEDLKRAKELLASAKLPRFATTIVVASSPRDRAEVAILRGLLAGAGIRLRAQFVPAATLYPSSYERPATRVPMGIATWCADWPGLAGRDVLGTIATPTGYAHLGGLNITRALAFATDSPPGEAATRWATADEAVVSTGALVPLIWTADDFALSQRVQGFTAAPMWPRGDPTAMWLQ